MLYHRGALITLFGVGLAVSLLRPRPVGIAVCGAGLLAFILAPSATAVGIALGFGAFVARLALFVLIGTVLQARQDRDRAPRSSAAPSELW